jgi:hypothetical protein
MTPDKVVCIALLLIVIMIILSFSMYYDYCGLSVANEKQKADIAAEDIKKELIYGGEVYHLSNNMYTYEDAANACKKYGGKLATRAQLEDAYKNGANWCSYGWSDNGEAYFPIQQSYYSKLKGANKKACGKVGINGGVFRNKSLKFGANCYGPRPPTESMKEGDTIASFNDSWLPDGSGRIETFTCNGTRIPILNLDDGYDKLHKF